jgi:hypothetical protein
MKPLWYMNLSHDNRVKMTDAAPELFKAAGIALTTLETVVQNDPKNIAAKEAAKTLRKAITLAEPELSYIQS